MLILNHSQATREYLGSDPKGGLMDTGSLLQPGRRLEYSETAEELVGALEVPERPLISAGYADIYCGFWTNPQGERVQVAVKELRTLTPKDRRTEEEALKTKIDTIYQTACGLEHLHSRDPPICHADIKPENILINDYHTATLSDFGLSRLVQDLEARSGFTTSETIKGTLRYMANELSAGEKPNLASDVYAFGGLILTVMSGKPPFDGLLHQVILRRVIQDHPPIQEDHPKLPPDDSLWKLMHRCWNYDPLARPTMGEVLLELLGQINHEESNPRSRPDLASITHFNLDDVIDEDGDVVDVGFISTTKYGWTAPKDEEDDNLDLDLHPFGRKPPVVKAPARRNALMFGTEAPARYVATQTAQQQLWFLGPDNDEKSILVNLDGGVRGGTLPALVERLTLRNYRDAIYNDAFLNTFKSFTTVDELFDLLVARFNIPEPAGLKPDEQKQWVEKKQVPIRFRVINILIMLMEGSVLEKEDMHVLVRIREFASEGVKVAPPAQQLIALVNRAENGEFGRVTQVTTTSQPPPAILPKSRRALKLMDVDPLEMARQLTIMESRMFVKIRPMECLSRVMEGQGHDDNIRKINNMSNKIASWVAEQVLSKDDHRQRGACIRQFIMITERCRELNNFSSMAALLAGLNSPSIRRLKRTWDTLDSRVTSQLDDVEKILDWGENFKGYRQLMATTAPPCIPFLGVYLKTLAFIQSANKDMLSEENNLINFGKWQKAAEVIREIKTYQSRPHNLTELPNVQDLIEKSLARVENSPDFWELSMQLEPREREDEKFARLLQESGFL
ncbi:hypothetical protein FRC04_006324 [Tulasnella sp. 424]|nr:hypothetical protein FRC04_006324 [Tulasnella sp. 424]